MNGEPDKTPPADTPEASAAPMQAKDDVPAVKMQSDPEWMDAVTGSVGAPEDTIGLTETADPDK